MPIRIKNMMTLEANCEGQQLVVWWGNAPKPDQVDHVFSNERDKDEWWAETVAQGKIDFFVYIPPNAGNLADLRSAYHIHIFGKINDDPPHEITAVLPKSGNFRAGAQLDLLDVPLDEWEDRVHAMDAATREATRRLAAALKINS